MNENNILNNDINIIENNNNDNSKNINNDNNINNIFDLNDILKELNNFTNKNIYNKIFEETNYKNKLNNLFKSSPLEIFLLRELIVNNIKINEFRKFLISCDYNSMNKKFNEYLIYINYFEENYLHIIFNILIFEYINSEDDEYSKKILLLFKIFYNNVSILPCFFKNFYQSISKIFYKSNYNNKNFFKIINLLEIIYSNKDFEKTFVQNFFLFGFFENNIGIQILKNYEIKKNKIFVLLVSFEVFDNNDISNIVDLEFDMKKNNKYNLQIKNESIIEQIEKINNVFPLIKNNMNFLKIIINSNYYFESHINNINNSHENTIKKFSNKIKELTLFKNFKGKIYNIIGLIEENKKNEKNQKLYSEEYFFEDNILENYNVLFNISPKIDFNNNLDYKSEFFYFINENEDLKIKIDLSIKNHFTLFYQENFNLFGGYKTLIPLFEILCLYSRKNIYKNEIEFFFEKLLNIIENNLNNECFCEEYNDFYFVICYILNVHFNYILFSDKMKTLLHKFVNSKKNSKINNLLKLNINYYIHKDEDNNVNDLSKYIINKILIKYNSNINENIIDIYKNLFPYKIELNNLNNQFLILLKIFIIYIKDKYFTNSEKVLFLYLIIFYVKNNKENINLFSEQNINEIGDDINLIKKITNWINLYENSEINNNLQNIKDFTDIFIIYILGSIELKSLPVLLKNYKYDNILLIYNKMNNMYELDYLKPYMLFLNIPILKNEKSTVEIFIFEKILEQILTEMNSINEIENFKKYFSLFSIFNNELKNIMNSNLNLNLIKNIIFCFIEILNLFISEKKKIIKKSEDKTLIYLISQNEEIIEKLINENLKNLYSKLNYNNINDIILKNIFNLYSGLFNYQDQKIFENILNQNNNKIIYSNEIIKDLLNEKSSFKKYKCFMKQLFLFNGFWANLNDNYIKKINNSKLKYKILNYVTNDFKKPLIYPMFNFDYYIPQFKSFQQIDKLFKKTNKNENLFELYDDYQMKQENNNDESLILNKITNNIFKLYDNSDIYNYFSDKNKKLHKCCLIKSNFHIKGYIFVDENKIIFHSLNNFNNNEYCVGLYNQIEKKEEQNIENNKNNRCYGSIFKCKDRYKNIHLEIDINDIKLILPRIYYYRKTAFEIYTFNGKNYYFNFFTTDSEKLENFINLNEYFYPIQSNLKKKDKNDNLKDLAYMSKNYIQNYYDIYLGEYGLIKLWSSKKYLTLDDFLINWEQYIISSFELLMYINIFSNRSYLDLNQYPVFPWVLYPNNKERDLSQMIGQIEYNNESIKRKTLFEKSYIISKEELEDESEYILDSDISKAYYYNTNYSNATYTCYYLLRLFPFTFNSIEFQGDFFDDPNRLFFDIEMSEKNSFIQKSDIKEIIPEFFYLPDFFYNINNINFFRKQINKEDDYVTTPINSLNLQSYSYTILLKQILEKSNIKTWIALIFGELQKSLEKKNLFRPDCYLDNPEIDLSKKEVLKKYNYEDENVLLATVEFGIIPTQTINTNLNFPSNFIPKKSNNLNNIKNPEIELNNNSGKIKIKLNNKEKGEINNKIINSFNNLKFKMILNTNLLLVYSEEIMIIIKNENLLDYFILNNRSKFKINVHFIKLKTNENFIYIFDVIKSIPFLVINENNPENKDLKINNSIKFIKHNNNNKDIINVYEKISYKNEIFYLFGYYSGLIILYKFDIKSEYIFMKLKEIVNNTSTILSINYNYKLNLWITNSKDNFINIYTFIDCKLVQSINKSEKKIIKAILSSNPLPSFILIMKRQILIYSINNYLNRIINNNAFDFSKIINVSLHTDENFNDNIIINSSNRNILILPIQENFTYIVEETNKKGGAKVVSIDFDICDISYDKDTKFIFVFGNEWSKKKNKLYLNYKEFSI